jgi:DNA repair photolyase
LFEQFSNIEVGISISTLDEKFARRIEPRASRPKARLEALKEVSQADIPTYTFVSPFFPEITDFKAIVEETVDYTDRFMFENLNFRPHNVPRILKLLKEERPELVPQYKEFQKDRTLWDMIEGEIENYCEKENLQYHIEFHHGGFSKS